LRREKRKGLSLRGRKIRTTPALQKEEKRRETALLPSAAKEGREKGNELFFQGRRENKRMSYRSQERRKIGHAAEVLPVEKKAKGKKSSCQIAFFQSKGAKRCPGITGEEEKKK